MNRSESGKLGWLKSADKLALLCQAKRDAAKAKWQGKVCKYCSKPIEYEKRRNDFCDHSCSAIFNNLGVAVRRRTNAPEDNFKDLVGELVQPRRASTRKESGIDIICARCAGPVPAGSVSLCSHTCRVEMRRYMEMADVLETGYFTTNATARKCLLRQHGNKCFQCGLQDWQGVHLPMIMDHIDGNSDNLAITNLRLLCPNCDAQTPTWKGKNRGNGRHERKMRARQGLSF